MTDKIDREIMQQALDFLVGGNFAYPTKLATALRERLAQPEQEPVAAGIVWHTPLGRYFAWLINPEDIPIGARLYTTPQQREWQGLTDEEEIRQTADQRGIVIVGEAMIAFARAIEAKLKEKNT
jgi:hypothetical protein